MSLILNKNPTNLVGPIRIPGGQNEQLILLFSSHLLATGYLSWIIHGSEDYIFLYTQTLELKASFLFFRTSSIFKMTPEIILVKVPER